MKISLDNLIAKIITGEINADDAAIEMDEKGIEVTEIIYDELRQAEAKHLKNKNGLQIGDTITVQGKNGNPDFTANYRGTTLNGKYVVVVCGSQFTIEKTDVKH